MKLKDVKLMSEMARTAEVCANCGRTKAEGHYYYAKDKQFHCRGKGMVFAPGGKPGVAAPAAAPTSTPAEGPAGHEPAAGGAPAAAPPPKMGKSGEETPAPVTSPEGLEARIKKWLEDHEISNFKMTPDGFIDVDGWVRFDDPTEKLVKFPGPVKFGTVTGDFISPVSLTTLRGCPEHVGTSEFGGDFVCAHSDITSLQNGPKTVGGSYVMAECVELQSFEGIAERVDGSIDAEKCPKIKNLHDIHKMLKHCGGTFKLKGTPIESHVLGLLFVKGLQSVQLDNNGVQEIINKHLKSPDRNVHDVQEELMDAGFAAFAKL